MNTSTTVLPGQPAAIAPDVHWVGALDPDLRQFDIILRTANGTSYNAYAVRGRDGVAVIDTVKAEFADDFFARLWACCKPAEIRAIVLNHLEPDHTGALPALLAAAPDARVYLSSAALRMLKGIVKDGIDESRLTVVDADTRVDLGGRTLRFLHTPYLHWPDTQCTWVEEDGLLFSGDVFGCHFCDERLFNDRVGDFRFSFDYYYQHIMRPFREHVLEALALIEALPIRLIAPAHGPVLRDAPRNYVQRYRQLASPLLTFEAGEHEKTLLVFYISAYGNTERMARAVRDGAEGVEGVRVSLYDLAGGDPAPFVDLIEEADGLMFGSPTINGDAVKPVWDLLSSLTLVKVKGKFGAAFGSFGWSGEAVRLIEDRLRGLKLRVPRTGVRVKLIPTDEELAECRALGRELAEHLVGRAQPLHIDFSAPGALTT
ncbi:FprA family A-type flavoprotein [Pseudothauera nasutitermitis]|uniref:FprA family A-type flavoprotein n=1 Tax=Pseudothauera nasutitermitis TaxID=2565930 RepID=A0A4V3WBU5_9RHOO|nr:FprA family A-type flavoprotein [Pseudothauera nasutitermitis]THF64589.1 FprA family A-type flavoprotein [Pseudothauera nasutitermitis]